MSGRNPDGYQDGFTVTPSDTTRLTANADAIYVGGAGALAVVSLGGNIVIFPAVPVGSVIPIKCTHVRSTGTGATNIVALTAQALPIGTLTGASTLLTELLTAGSDPILAMNGDVIAMSA